MTVFEANYAPNYLGFIARLPSPPFITTPPHHPSLSSSFRGREKSYVFVLCAPPDLREIVFVLQSQSNSHHAKQAERKRADLLAQARAVTEVRFHKAPIKTALQRGGDTDF